MSPSRSHQCLGFGSFSCYHRDHFDGAEIRIQLCSTDFGNMIAMFDSPTKTIRVGATKLVCEEEVQIIASALLEITFIIQNTIVFCVLKFLGM